MIYFCRHAVIQRLPSDNGDSCCRIKDLNSTNGVKVNKNKITRNVWSECNVSDVIRVGASNMLLSTEFSIVSTVKKRRKMSSRNKIS